MGDIGKNSEFDNVVNDNRVQLDNSHWQRAHSAIRRYGSIMISKRYLLTMLPCVAEENGVASVAPYSLYVRLDMIPMTALK
jgi:hypothetical protein